MASRRIVELHRLRQLQVNVAGSESLIHAAQAPSSTPEIPKRPHGSGGPEGPDDIPLPCEAHSSDPTGSAVDGVNSDIEVFDDLYAEVVVQKSRPFNAHRVLKRIMNRNAAGLRVRTRRAGSMPRYEHAEWIGWPETNGERKEAELCEYLNALADSVREVLKRPQTPDDLVFSSESGDSDPETSQTTDRKPNLVVIPRWIRDKKDADWGDVRAVVSLETSIQDRTKEIEQITEYARCCFASQDNRRYVLGLGFLHNNLAFYVFDRSGILVTPHYDINDHPERFLEFAISILFMDDVQLGYDPSITLEDDVWSVRAGGKAYEILDCLYVDHSIRGRGTVCFKVQDEKKRVFVVKDAWIDRTRKKTEADFLNELKGSGIKNVPTIVSHEIVPLPGDATGRDCTENFRKKLILEELNGKDRTEALTMFRGIELRDHYRIVQGPYGELLEDFDSLPELLSATLDILNVIEELDKIGVIHSDISINNIILVDNPSARYRKGYLIDFDSATRKDGVKEAVKGKLMGTLLFMAVDMMQMKSTRLSVHDAESLLYCLIYLSYTQQGPHYAKRTDELANETSFLDPWCLVGDLNEEKLHAVAASKFLVMTSVERFEEEVIHQTHPYFKPLWVCFRRMREALFPPSPRILHSDDASESATDGALDSLQPDIEADRSSGVVLGELKSIVSSSLETLEEMEEKARADHATTKSMVDGESNAILGKEHPEAQGAASTSGEDVRPPSRDAAPMIAATLSRSPSPETIATISSPTQILGKRPREIIQEPIVGEVLSNTIFDRPAKQRLLKA